LLVLQEAVEAYLVGLSTTQMNVLCMQNAWRSCPRICSLQDASEEKEVKLLVKLRGLCTVYPGRLVSYFVFRFGNGHVGWLGGWLLSLHWWSIALCKGSVSGHGR
jgi:hypothetical protein